MRTLTPRLVVEARAPRDERRTSISWVDHDFRVAGDNHVAHGGAGSGPDGFDLLAAALGQCLLTTLLAKAQADGLAITAATATVATKARLQGELAAPYLSDFRIEIELEGELDEQARADLERHTQQMCGVRETLLRTPRIEEHVRIKR
jgi:uncharacterized OsmC-like protein